MSDEKTTAEALALALSPQRPSRAEREEADAWMIVYAFLFGSRLRFTFGDEAQSQRIQRRAREILDGFSDD